MPTYFFDSSKFFQQTPNKSQKTANRLYQQGKTNPIRIPFSHISRQQHRLFVSQEIPKSSTNFIFSQRRANIRKKSKQAKHSKHKNKKLHILLKFVSTHRKENPISYLSYSAADNGKYTTNIHLISIFAKKLSSHNQNKRWELRTHLFHMHGLFFATISY